MEGCACTQEKAHEVLAKYKGKKGVLVHMLQDLQYEFGYLPENALGAVAEETNLSLAHIYGVASFYAHFYFKPRGKNIIRICTGTACHVRGAQKVLNEFECELGLKDGETSEDLKYTLETVSCVGCCALAPVVVVNNEVSKEKNSKKIRAKLEENGGEKS